jgi:hypothetical protein
MATEVLKSELDLFKNINYQASITSSNLIPYRPISSIENSNTIEFVIPGNSEEYIDLQDIFLWVKANIVNEDGTPFPENQNGRYSLINYGLNTMWDQVDIYLNNTLISQSSNTYAYRSYIECLIGKAEMAKYSYLKAAGFNPPKVGNLNFDNIDTDIAAISKESKEFTLYGRIHGDIFNSQRLLINGVTIRLVFTRAKDNFCLMGSVLQTGDPTASPPRPALAGTNPKLNVKDVCLFVRKVQVNSSILNAHARILQTDTCKYPIKRVEIKTFSLSPSQSTFVLDNIFMGQLPSNLIIGICEHDSQLGEYTKNPLTFKNFGLNYLTCHMNGTMYPSIPYQPDYDKDLYARELVDFYSNIGQTNTEPLFKSSFHNYKDGYNFYAFNFNSDQQITPVEDFINIPKEGYLRLEVHFKENLKNPLKVMCYGIFENMIEINNNRKVTIDY